ncbi:MAG: 50S ribosomal protein L17 [Mycoplasmoidaceae bacterium]|nr:50S ribosomal protein L17 [Mycoplasmoidaceae bacterium]
METTQAKAKELKKHVDHLITLGKKNTLAAKREIMAFVKDNKQMKKEAVLKKLTTTLAKKYADRKGGYTRVIKLDDRAGDNTKMAIIQLV